jgi:uncharacterized protein
MIRWTRAAVRAWLERLLHVHDSPRRTAAAFALGVFIGFSPFLGLHTLLALTLAFLLGLNRVAVIIGVYSNLPWIMAQWYTLMTALGAWLLGTGLPPGFSGRLRQLFALSLLDAEFWRRLADLLRPLLWPYVVGSTLGAAVLAGVAFVVARGFIEARRRHLFHLPHHGGGAQHRP